MKMPTLLERLLPFPVHLPEEVEALDLASPDDLADPHLAEAILNAVMDGALAQGADPRGAAWYASLVAGALTGWSVSVVPPPEVEQAYSHTFDPSGIFTMRGHLAPDWEALLGDGAFLQALEEAWVVARDMGRGRLLSVAEAAALVGIPAEELARRLERGRGPQGKAAGTGMARATRRPGRPGDNRWRPVAWRASPTSWGSGAGTSSPGGAHRGPWPAT